MNTALKITFGNKLLQLVTCMLFLYFHDQWTALHAAAAKGRDYTVECLVKRGAKVDIKDKYGVCVTILL